MSICLDSWPSVGLGLEFFVWFYFGFFVVVIVVVLVFQDRVSLCIPGYPGIESIDQADLELRGAPASAS